METLKPHIETQLDLPEDWYMDGSQVSKVYEMISLGRLNEAQIKDLYYQVQDKLRFLLSQTDQSTAEVDLATRLNTIARELFQYFLHPVESKPSFKPKDEEGIIEAEGVH